MAEARQFEEQAAEHANRGRESGGVYQLPRYLLTPAFVCVLRLVLRTSASGISLEKQTIFFRAKCFAVSVLKG